MRISKFASPDPLTQMTHLFPHLNQRLGRVSSAQPWGGFAPSGCQCPLPVPRPPVGASFHPRRLQHKRKPGLAGSRGEGSRPLRPNTWSHGGCSHQCFGRATGHVVRAHFNESSAVDYDERPNRFLRVSSLGHTTVSSRRSSTTMRVTGDSESVERFLGDDLARTVQTVRNGTANQAPGLPKRQVPTNDSATLADRGGRYGSGLQAGEHEAPALCRTSGPPSSAPVTHAMRWLTNAAVGRSVGCVEQDVALA